MKIDTNDLILLILIGFLLTNFFNCNEKFTEDPKIWFKKDTYLPKIIVRSNLKGKTKEINPRSDNPYYRSLLLACNNRNPKIKIVKNEKCLSGCSLKNSDICCTNKNCK